MTAAGALIWISIRPLIRLILCATSGFILTKLDLFPIVAARTLGQILLNVTLPSLMFSKMVPAFNSDNVSALGPLVLVALIYEGIGVVMAWLVKQVFWVPHRFRYGILVAGGWGNVGDIPTSVVMSITGAAPFNPDKDQDLSVAYISVFVLVYMVTLFPMGAHRLIAKDFVGPDVEHEEVREQVSKRRRTLLYGWPKALAQLRHRRRRSQDQKDPESPIVPDASEKEMDSGHAQEKVECNTLRPRSNKHVSFDRDGQDQDGSPSEVIVSPTPTEKIVSPTPTVTAYDPLESQLNPTGSSSKQVGDPEDSDPSDAPVPLSPSRRRLKKVYRELRAAIKSILTPASISILSALPIALIPQLKGLFVQTDGSGIPNAPDGEPPLAFILDFTTFMGAASVPMGLVGLGSALARIHVPRDQWKNLPLGAIFSLAILKLAVSPVLGVLITHGLVSAGIIDREDKVIQFMTMFFSCLPTATTQVFITQVYSGTGSAEFMSPFLLPQYFIMIFSMTAINAYALNFLF
ncbi:Protein M3 [Stygiomarasmius scandens]|uniref:Protein M3 n=1 Tax=Marasmiellus scandens TaxID=2682957 RepID=A0ABR1JPP6_9AGAR